MMVIPDCDECRALHGALAIHKGESVLDAEVRVGWFESIEPGCPTYLRRRPAGQKTLSANASSSEGAAGDMEESSNSPGTKMGQPDCPVDPYLLCYFNYLK